MMKFSGKEYEYSVLKVFLPDVSFDQLKQLTAFYEMPNNAHTIVALINTYYNEMVAVKEFMAQEEIRKKNAEDRRSKEVGTSSTESSNRDNGQDSTS